MEIIDMTGGPINTAVVRQLVRSFTSLDPERMRVRMHPNQIAAWQSCGMSVACLVKTKNVGVSEIQKALTAPPPRFAGYPIEPDGWFQEDKIRFEYDGRPLAGIKNLAVLQTKG